MTEIVAGWYPDPAGGPLNRWWDGRQWTAATVPLTPAYAGPPPASSYTPQPLAQDPYRGPLPYNTQPGYGTAAGYGTAPRTAWQRNRYTLITAGVVIGYAILGLATHFVLIGILPIVFAVRAFRARERLAPLAAVAAGLSVILSIMLLA
ncbi:MAG: DUF2510 domain-containing protein [Jatrophihabitans sp.]